MSFDYPETWYQQARIGVSIIIKPASFNFLRSIAAGIGAHIVLYCLVGMLPWYSRQPTLGECNPLGAIILGSLVDNYMYRPPRTMNDIFSSYQVKGQRMDPKLTIYYPRISPFSSPKYNTWGAFEPGSEIIGPI